MTMGLACDRDGYDLRFPRPDAAGEMVLSLAQIAALAGPPIQRQRGINVTVVMTPFGAVPNRLKGAYINEYGEAV